MVQNSRLRHRARTALDRARAAFASRAANSEDFESRLTWILGSPRSGSTWLLNMLAAHNDVMPIDEPLIGWYLGPFLSDLPQFDPRSLDLETFTMRRAQARNGHQFFTDHYVAAWQPALARMMRERFYAQVVDLGAGRRALPRSVAIKEPSGSQSADLLTRALPRSRVLFLLRDGRDVVDSELAASLEGAWLSRQFAGLRGIREDERLGFVTQSALKWLWRTEVVESAVAAHPGPTLMIRYEELRREPVAIMRQIFSWLGLEVSEQALDVSVENNRFERMPVTGAQEFVRSAAPGSWRENLRPDEQAVLKQLLSRKLRELGYEP